MPLEQPTTIKDLYPNYPFDGDLVSQGRLHLINYKIAIVNTFPLITEPVTTTETYLKNLFSKITFVDDSLTFNMAAYKREGPIATTSQTLRELYITKDQKLKVREPLPPLGTVIESVLTLTSIRSLYGKDKEGREIWDILNGQTITGSKLQVEMGIASLPNAFTKFAFLAAPGSGENLNTPYPYNTNLTPLKITLAPSGKHGEAEHKTKHDHTWINDFSGYQDDRDNGSSGPMWDKADDTDTRGTYYYSAYTAYNEGLHNHVITTLTWGTPPLGTELAPKALRMNYFVRIN